MPYKPILTLLSLALAALLLFTQTLPAQPARDRILGKLEIYEEAEQASIRVAFNFPVRYLRHFPASSGDELRIQLEPIAIAAVDKDALFKRETVLPPLLNLAALAEVIYEGDMVGGPYLTLRFHNPAGFSVQQGSDYRSLVVVVQTPYPATPVEAFDE